MKSLIVMPTYNEQDTIAGLVADICRYLPVADVLIIDDNSPDGTGQVADDLAARMPQVRVLHRQGKLGLGTAYVLGFHYAIAHDYECVFEMDADYSHDPQYLPRFHDIAQHADLVIGSRYIAGGGTPNWSPLRRFISGGGNIFARAVLGIPVHDCTSGYRCYRTSVLRKLNLDAIHAQGYAFQVELAYNAWRAGCRIEELPIIFVDRRVGKSKMSRRIFAEAFLWVLRARITGDADVRRPHTGKYASPALPLAESSAAASPSQPSSAGE